MKFSVRNNLIALFIFYAIFLTFLNAFYGNSVPFIPSYLHSAINYLGFLKNTMTSTTNLSSVSIVSALFGLVVLLASLVVMIADFIFIFFAVISLIFYYPYLVLTYIPAPINILIFTVTIVILMIDIITGIQILQSGFTGGNE